MKLLEEFLCKGTAIKGDKLMRTIAAGLPCSGYIIALFLILSFPINCFASGKCYELTNLVVEGGTGIGKALAGKTITISACITDASKHTFEDCVSMSKEQSMGAGIIIIQDKSLATACWKHFPNRNSLQPENYGLSKEPFQPDYSYYKKYATNEFIKLIRDMHMGGEHGIVIQVDNAIKTSSQNMLLDFVGNEYYLVRWATALNPNISDELLTKLLDDTSLDVISAAKRKLDTVDINRNQQ